MGKYNDVEVKKDRGQEKEKNQEAGKGCGYKSDEMMQEASAASVYMENADRSRRRPEKEGRTGLPPDPRIPAGGGHREEEYFALPEDLRVELIDGVFHAMASPERIHQTAVFQIAKQLDQCMEEHDSPCFLYIAPSDVALGDDKNTIVQPDIYVHCDRDKDREPGPYRGTPDFVVEVLSSSNPENDLWRKRELYRRYGVREYWIVNPRGRKIYVFDFSGSRKEDIQPEEYGFDDQVPVGISDGSCAVDFKKIYRRIEHLL